MNRPGWLLTLLVAAMLFVPRPALAQPGSWVGKRVIPKQPGLRIGHSDDDGKQVYVAELTSLAYTVLADRDGFVRLEHRGKSGWIAKTETLLVDDAIAYFTERARINDPRDSFALAFLGWAYREKGDLRQALKCYDEILHRGPTPDWFNNRGAILLEMKQYEKALADFEEALKRIPDLATALENRARTLGQLRRIDQALADWTLVLKRRPDYVEGYRQRAQLQLAKKDPDAALLDYGAALTVQPKNLDLWLDRARVYADHRIYEKAFDDLAEAIKLAGDASDRKAAALAQRASVHALRKDYDKALADLADALKLEPDDFPIQEAIGWNRFLSGQFAEANRDFEALVRAHPKEPSAYNCQAWLWATCPKAEFRNGQKAVEYARKAVELSSEKDPTYLDTLAAALAELGRFDEAITTQERVVREAAEDPELLGEAQARLALYRKKTAYRQPLGK